MHTNIKCPHTSIHNKFKKKKINTWILAPTASARSTLFITNKSLSVIPGPPLRGILSPPANFTILFKHVEKNLYPINEMLKICTRLVWKIIFAKSTNVEKKLHSNNNYNTWLCLNTKIILVQEDNILRNFNEQIFCFSPYLKIY